MKVVLYTTLLLRLIDYLHDFLNDSEFKINVSQYLDKLPNPDYSYGSYYTRSLMEHSFISHTIYKIAGYNYRELIILMIFYLKENVVYSNQKDSRSSFMNRIEKNLNKLHNSRDLVH